MSFRCGDFDPIDSPTPILDICLRAVAITLTVVGTTYTNILRTLVAGRVGCDISLVAC